MRTEARGRWNHWAGAAQKDRFPPSPTHQSWDEKEKTTALNGIEHLPPASIGSLQMFRGDCRSLPGSKVPRSAFITLGRGRGKTGCSGLGAPSSPPRGTEKDGFQLGGGEIQIGGSPPLLSTIPTFVWRWFNLPVPRSYTVRRLYCTHTHTRLQLRCTLRMLRYLWEADVF